MSVNLVSEPCRCGHNSVVRLPHTIALFELTFFIAVPDSQTLVVAPYYAANVAGVRANQSIGAIAVIYKVTTVVWLLIAPRFVDPTQIVTHAKQEAH